MECTLAVRPELVCGARHGTADSLNFVAAVDTVPGPRRRHQHADHHLLDRDRRRNVVA
jgi:hypothetical protein